MGRTIEEKITRFDRGMINDPRSDEGIARVIKNFDNNSFTHKLVPYNSSLAAGGGLGDTEKARALEVAPISAGNYRKFALGVTNAGTKTKIWRADLTGNSWSALTNGKGTSMDTTDFELFIYYAKTGRIYGAADGTTIWSVDPADSAPFDETDDDDKFAHTLVTAYNNPRSTDAANRPNISGLVHSKDDILYIGYDNIIILNSGSGDWTDPALTLPVDRVITSLSEYGNYLAIATKDRNTVGKSIVYLWNRDTSLTTVTETVDFGEGNLEILEEIDGTLVGISILGSDTTNIFSRLVFRSYDGRTAKIFKQFTSEANYNANDLRNKKQKVNNTLYFLLTFTISDVVQEGVWKIGRNSLNSGLAVSIHRTPNNDTALTATKSLEDFLIAGDYTTILYQSGSAYSSSVTDASNHDHTSELVTKIFDGGDSSITKNFIGATVFFEPLTNSAWQVSLDYKKDAETSWTTIITDFTSATSEMRKFVDAVTAGIGDFKEIQFRIRSEKGAVITGFSFKYKEIEDKPY